MSTTCSLSGAGCIATCLKELYEINDIDIVKYKGVTVPLPEQENARIAIMRQARLFDTDPEDSFDRYTNLATRTLRVPIALISLMDVDRQWFKSRVGLDVSQTHRNLAFCSYTILERTPRVMIVPNALEDPRFCDSPLVLGFPNIRFYAGVSLIVNKLKIGTLCIIDTVPRYDFSQRDIEILTGFGDMISELICSRRQDILETENDLARIIANVLQLIRRPLKRLTDTFQHNILSQWREYFIQQHLPTNPYTTKAFLTQFSHRLSLFLNELEDLNKLLDKSLNVTVRMIYNGHIHNEPNHYNTSTPPSLQQAEYDEEKKQTQLVPSTKMQLSTNAHHGHDIHNMVQFEYWDLNNQIINLITKHQYFHYIYQNTFIEDNPAFHFLTQDPFYAFQSILCYSHSDIILLVLEGMLRYITAKGYKLYTVTSHLNTSTMLTIYTEQDTLQQRLHTISTRSAASDSSGGSQRGAEAIITYLTFEFLIAKQPDMFRDGKNVNTFLMEDELDSIKSFIEWIDGYCKVFHSFEPLPLALHRSGSGTGNGLSRSQPTLYPIPSEDTEGIIVQFNIPCCFVTEMKPLDTETSSKTVASAILPSLAADIFPIHIQPIETRSLSHKFLVLDETTAASATSFRSLSKSIISCSPKHSDGNLIAKLPTPKHINDIENEQLQKPVRRKPSNAASTVIVTPRSHQEHIVDHRHEQHEQCQETHHSLLTNTSEFTARFLQSMRRMFHGFHHSQQHSGSGSNANSHRITQSGSSGSRRSSQTSASLRNASSHSQQLVDEPSNHQQPSLHHHHQDLLSRRIVASTHHKQHAVDEENTLFAAPTKRYVHQEHEHPIIQTMILPTNSNLQVVPIVDQDVGDTKSYETSLNIF